MSDGEPAATGTLHGHASRVQTLLGLGRYQDAIRESAQAIASDPEEPLHHYNLARAQLGAEDPKGADDSVRRAVALAPEWPPAYFLLSLTRNALKDFDGELRAARRAAEIDPEHPTWLDRLARAQMQSGMLRPAQDTARQLVKLAPEDADTHSLLADISMQLNDHKTAEPHVRAALRAEPESPVLLNDLGLALMGQKQWAEAVDAFLAAAKAAPDQQAIRQNLEHSARELAGVFPFGSRQGRHWDRLPPAVQSYLSARHEHQGWMERYRSEVMLGIALGILLLMTLFFSTFV